MPTKTSPDFKTADRQRLLQNLPAFSPVAVKLLSALANESVSFKEIAQLITIDPVLAGEVLRLANSGLYGRRVEVDSILCAITMLGCGKLSQIAVTAALWRGMSRRATPFVRDWWRHSIAAAIIASKSSEEKSKDFAYTAALLHGVGQLALFEDVPQNYPNLIESAYTNGIDLLVLENEDFGIDHAALAGLILESWELPGTLCEAVTKHHDQAPATDLVRAVQIGCAGAEWAGFGRCGCNLLLASGIPGPLAELFNGDYLDVLSGAVNRIECSLV
jgi:HD-like signal output (HDOD) protein